MESAGRAGGVVPAGRGRLPGSGAPGLGLGRRWGVGVAGAGRGRGRAGTPCRAGGGPAALQSVVRALTASMTDALLPAAPQPLEKKSDSYFRKVGSLKRIGESATPFPSAVEAGSRARSPGRPGREGEGGGGALAVAGRAEDWGWKEVNEGDDDWGGGSQNRCEPDREGSRRRCRRGVGGGVPSRGPRVPVGGTWSLRCAASLRMGTQPLRLLIPGVLGGL